MLFCSIDEVCCECWYWNEHLQYPQVRGRKCGLRRGFHRGVRILRLVLWHWNVCFSMRKSGQADRMGRKKDTGRHFEVNLLPLLGKETEHYFTKPQWWCVISTLTINIISEGRCKRKPLLQMQWSKQRFFWNFETVLLQKTKDDNKADSTRWDYLGMDLHVWQLKGYFANLVAFGELWCQFEYSRLFLPKTCHLCHLQGEYMPYSAVPMS